MTAPTTRDVGAEHHDEREALVSSASRVAGQMWSEVDPDRIVDSWARRVPELTAVVSGAQFAAAREADPYLAEVLSAQGLAGRAVGRVDPRGFSGTSVDGRGLLSLLIRPAFEAIARFFDGRDVARSVAAGAQSLDTIVRTEVADAGRLADQVSLAAHPSAGGYIRLTDGDPCARCLVLAGRFYRWSDGFKRHERCNCTHVPVGAGVRPQDPREMYDAMTPQQRTRAGFTAGDQDALAKGADLNQVVNARHRPNALRTAGGRRFTTEGTTSRGLAGRGPRLTPDQIFADATSREHAIRLLERNGYLLEPRRTGSPRPRPPTVDLSRQSVARLRAMVAEHGITVPTGLRKPGLVKLVDDLDSGVTPAMARQRAVLTVVDERRVSADALVRASEIVGNAGSARALRHVGGVLRRELPAELQTTFRPLLDALDAGDLARAQAAIPVVARGAKLKQVGGAVGDVKPFRRGEMEWIGGSRSAQVLVVRPGYATTLDGSTTVLSRAAVLPATPEQIARLPVKAAKKAAAPAKKAIAAKRAPALERTSIAALKAELQRVPGAPTLTGVPKPVLASWTRRARELPPGSLREEAGRWRQTIIEKRRALAEALAEADELLANGASATVLGRRAASRLKRLEQDLAGWPELAEVRKLATAMASGNPAHIRRAIDSAQRRAGLKQVGDNAGSVARFDRATMSPLSGARIPDGAAVVVVRPGYSIDIGGGRIVIARPVVEEAT